MIPSRLGGELFTGLLPSVPSVVKFEGAERILSLRPFSIEILSFHYWRAPRGPRGVKWSPIDQYTCHWRFDVLRLTPNWINYKTLTKLKKNHSKCLFLKVFWILINFGSISAHQTSNTMFSELWRFFWHPSGFWERMNSGDTSIFWFVHYIISAQLPSAPHLRSHYLVLSGFYGEQSPTEIQDEHCQSFGQNWYLSGFPCFECLQGKLQMEIDC